uniref:Secreted protein n=1 Tax=Caenorhabditis japonica TaxID=281687 RepID=A0A8R1IHJ4_CAEJA
MIIAHSFAIIFCAHLCVYAFPPPFSFNVNFLVSSGEAWRNGEETGQNRSTMCIFVYSMPLDRKVVVEETGEAAVVG